MHKKKRIAGSGWRKPKGITNKRRLNRKGHPDNVRPGFGSLASSRNMVDNLEIVFVNSLSDFVGLDPKVHCVVLGRAGKQKKLDLIKKAEELKLKIINLDVDKFKLLAQEFFDARKKVSKEKLDAKKKKEAELKEAEKKEAAKKKEAEKKEASADENLSEEEKKKEEKKEKDKVLTQKS